MVGEVALIDADVLCYTAALSATKEIDFDGAGVQEYLNPGVAKEVADETLEKWMKKAGCTDYRLAFSDRSMAQATFRYHVHPHYKGNRTGEKPELHDLIYEYLHSKPAVISRPGLEGDDILGLMVTGVNKDAYTAVTVDKDLLTVPGRVCIIPCGPTPAKARTRVISEFEADYNWMTQTLTGDLVDNYNGAPGIGPKKAAKLLAGCRGLAEMWAKVVEGYNAQFGDDRWFSNFCTATAWDEAIMNARCARILRHGDYAADTGTIRLWEPDGKYEFINGGGV